MIRTDSLTKYFGRRKAVDNFSVEIGSQRIVGFLGLNGAGKTTTLRILAGLLAPSEGRVFIHGIDLNGPEGHKARAKIGFLPDRPPLYDDMTVRNFVHFAGKLQGKTPSIQRLHDVLEQTGLESLRDTTIGKLSHGYRQRLGVAQAIVHEPSLVVLDEPTNGLDPKQIVEMRKLISSLSEHHTVLLSSHNLPEVEECCHEVLVIDEGKLAARGSPEELERQLSQEGQRIAVTAIGSEQSFKSLGKSFVLEHLTTAQDGAKTFEVLSKDPPEKVSSSLFAAGLQLRKFQPVANSVQFLFERLTAQRATSAPPSGSKEGQS